MRNVVKSPCISACFLNDDDICEGCYRSMEEITHWGVMSSEQRLQVFENIKERLAERKTQLL